jgi:hypothetical protein
MPLRHAAHGERRNRATVSRTPSPDRSRGAACEHALVPRPSNDEGHNQSVGKDSAKQIYSELAGWTSTVACRLRVQWFFNGKMKDIKGRGGTKKQFVGIDRATGEPIFRTHGLSNNLRAGIGDVKQVHSSKDDPRKASLVIERGAMAFWVTVSEADDPAVLHRLFDELHALVGQQH